jgi:hypothetical protein
MQAGYRVSIVPLGQLISVNDGPRPRTSGFAVGASLVCCGAKIVAAQARSSRSSPVPLKLGGNHGAVAPGWVKVVSIKSPSRRIYGVRFLGLHPSLVSRHRWPRIQRACRRCGAGRSGRRCWPGACERVAPSGHHDRRRRVSPASTVVFERVWARTASCEHCRQALSGSVQVAYPRMLACPS